MPTEADTCRKWIVPKTGFPSSIGCHTFRATGSTAYLEAGDSLENAQAMGLYESLSNCRNGCWPANSMLRGRYQQQRSIVLTTNKPFGEWNQVFPNAACVVTLRAQHHQQGRRVTLRTPYIA